MAADPPPSAPAITALERSPGQVLIEWSDAGLGAAYTVQTRPALGEGIWVAPRAGVPWPISSREWIDSLNPDGGARFYRVAAVPRAQRGAVTRGEAIGSYSASQINLALFFAGVPLTVSHDVRLYKLVYETVGPWGERTIASGALALPQNLARPLPLCSYQHGTLAKRSEAPSASSSNEQLLGAVLAASGYATVMPDYLGLGDSTVLHPYHHAASEASACVDMLRAARLWCAGANVSLNDQLFLVGYSQGGHATMALHRDLEEFHSAEFTVTASAPMAGAYDLSGVTADDVLSGRLMPNPYYFLLLLGSYQSVYHFAPSLADVLAPPYDSTLPPLLDGQHTGSQINAAMPADATRILKPGYLAAFRSQPDHPLRQALRDNDLYRWTPKAPLRMYHCQGDGDVVFANSQVAVNSFHARGATQVLLFDPMPTANHGGCTTPSLVDAKLWFDSLRN